MKVRILLPELWYAAPMDERKRQKITGNALVGGTVLAMILLALDLLVG